MDIEAKIDAIRGGHLHVIAQLSIGETMDICSRLRAYEKELADLRAYKQSAEAKLKEYEQATKLSGEVNAKLVGELLEMQGKVAAMESQKPCATLLEVDEENMSYEYFEIHEHIPVGTDLYMKPVPADKPAVAVPEITTAMYMAGCNAYHDNMPFKNENVELIFKAMLAAAPTHSQQSAQLVPDCLRKVCEAWKSKKEATDRYNLRLKEVNKMRAKGDWNKNTDKECQELSRCSKEFESSVKEMINETLPLLDYIRSASDTKGY